MSRCYVGITVALCAQFCCLELKSIAYEVDLLVPFSARPVFQAEPAAPHPRS